MKKVLWFSRHQMTPEQKEALGEVSITQVNGNMPNVHVPFQAEVNGVTQEVAPFKELLREFDIIAIVAPIGLQQQILGVAGDRPVISALNRRVLVPDENGGEDKVHFIFDGWERLLKIEVVKEPFHG